MREALAGLNVLCAVEERRIFPIGSEKKEPLARARPKNPKWSWQTEEFTDVSLRSYVTNGIMLATCPASLGFWVVDIDSAPEQYACVTDVLGEPAALVKTRRGYHAWYRLPDDPTLTIRNRKWQIGECAGELRGHNGYVALWDIPSVAQIVEQDAQGAFQPVSPFPALLEAERASTPTDAPPRTVEASEPSERLTEALSWLGPDRLGPVPDYDTWIRLGQAVHDETGGHAAGFELWDDWSVRFDNYPSGDDPSTAAKWQSFHAGRGDGVTAGSVYKLAEEHGWVEDVTSDFDDLSTPSVSHPQDEDAETPVTETKLKKPRPVVKDRRMWTLKSIYKAMNVELRYNVRLEDSEIKEGNQPWELPSDGQIINIRERIAANFLFQDTKKGKNDPEFLVFEKQALFDLNEAIAYENKVDPFFDWLTELPPWDGIERVDTWIEHCWTVSDQYPIALTRWAARFILLGAIARTYDPGCELDEMPILVGHGGLGKSKAIKYLLPRDHRKEWFTDRFNFDTKEKEQAEKMLGAVIVEASEMSGIRKAMNTNIKSAVSGATEKARLAYRRNASTLERRCVVIGTGDNEEILPNDLNLRRFVPVVLTGGTSRQAFRYIESNQTMLWAEALQLYHEGVEARLPQHLKPAQSEVSQDFRGRDERMEDLVNRLNGGRGPEEKGHSLTDLMDSCGADSNDHRQGRNFAQALRNAQWVRVKTRLGNRSLQRWFPPHDWQTVHANPMRHRIDDDFEDLDNPL